MSTVPPYDAAAQKSILDVLPNELTTEIIDSCDTGTKAALCLVSRVFKQLAHQQMYRIVRLPISDAKEISFARAMSDNPQYAVWVRVLSISRYRMTDAIVPQILPRLTELQQLSLGWGGNSKIPDFKVLTFPRLLILSLAGRAEIAAVIAFLNRHPTLLHLDIRHLRLYSGSAWHSSINLPNLVTFRGSATGINLRMLMNSGRLTSACFSAKELDQLARFPACQNVFITLVRVTGIHQMFDQLKHYLPNLKCCMLALNYNTDPIPSILSEELSGFKVLELFGVVVLNRLAQWDTATKIQTCLVSCPNLTECAFLNLLLDNGRYNIIDRKAQPTNDLSRMEA